MQPVLAFSRFPHAKKDTLTCAHTTALFSHPNEIIRRQRRVAHIARRRRKRSKTGEAFETKSRPVRRGPINVHRFCRLHACFRRQRSCQTEPDPNRRGGGGTRSSIEATADRAALRFCYIRWELSAEGLETADGSKTCGGYSSGVRGSAYLPTPTYYYCRTMPRSRPGRGCGGSGSGSSRSVGWSVCQKIEPVHFIAFDIDLR